MNYLKISFLFLFSFSLFSCELYDNDISPNPLAKKGAKTSNTDRVSASDCECVGYVKNQLGIYTSTNDAKYWGDTYTPSGYSVVPLGAPTSGDIMVIQPYATDVNGNYILSSRGNIYGHIGIIKSIKYHSDNTYTVTLRGAAQGSANRVTEVNCNNVNDMSILVYPDNSNKMRFLRKSYFAYADNNFFPFGNTPTNYTPSLNTFTNCSTSSSVTSCGTSNRNLFKVKITQGTSRFIQMEMQTCSGYFPESSRIFVKNGDLCSEIIAADYVTAGWSYRQIKLPNKLVAGHNLISVLVITSTGQRYHAVVVVTV